MKQKQSVSELLSKMPLEVKKRLLDLADRLPKHQAKVFLSTALERIGQIYRDYECTICFAGLGYVLGCILDQLPLVPDEVRVIGLVLGAAYGLRKDTERRSFMARHNDLHEKLIEALIEALRAAQAANGQRPAHGYAN